MEPAGHVRAHNDPRERVLGWGRAKKVPGGLGVDGGLEVGGKELLYRAVWCGLCVFMHLLQKKVLLKEFCELINQIHQQNWKLLTCYCLGNGFFSVKWIAKHHGKWNGRQIRLTRNISFVDIMVRRIMIVKANLLLIIYYQLASSYAVMEVWLSVTLMPLKPSSWGFKGSFQISEKSTKHDAKKILLCSEFCIFR